MKHLTILFLLLSNSLLGQDQLTLQRCVDLALANPLQTNVENAEMRTALINRKYQYWSLIPDLNANIGFNTSFGRRIDPFTNTFTTKNVNSQTFGLNSSVTVFDGFQFRYNRMILDYSIQQKELSVERRQNDLLLRIIDLYTEQCKRSIQISQLGLRIEKYRALQGIQQQLIKAGKISSIDTLKSHNSLLNEEFSLAKLESEQGLKNIELNFLMGVPLLETHAFDPSSLSALTTIPQLQEDLETEHFLLEAKITENQLRADRSSILPTLSLNGAFGTGFSTNRKYTTPNGATIPYSDQLQQNLSENIGISLNVPMFNRGVWLRSKQLSEIKRTQLKESIQMSEHEVEMHLMEIEQTRILKKAEIRQTEQIVANLLTIYDKTLLLYSEGRISYTEVETVFMEWQTKITDLETLKLEFEKLSLLAK
jgi:outer membrane protein TolC